jgi:hypothetical protein
MCSEISEVMCSWHEQLWKHTIRVSTFGIIHLLALTTYEPLKTFLCTVSSLLRYSDSHFEFLVGFLSRGGFMIHNPIEVVSNWNCTWNTITACQKMIWTFICQCDVNLYFQVWSEPLFVSVMWTFTLSVISSLELNWTEHNSLYDSNE